LKETLTRGHWKAHREFWALSDVSFEVESGDHDRIIGPNGSGKSTLLQIITGTLEPRTAASPSQVGSAALLELGAGFDPQFTGIENIFMNHRADGAFQAATERLLPEIANFAEIGDFHLPAHESVFERHVRPARFCRRDCRLSGDTDHRRSARGWRRCLPALRLHTAASRKCRRTAPRFSLSHTIQAPSGRSVITRESS
jgi:energy-coupling factor transporter ATP-binding protein EcfA2